MIIKKCFSGHLGYITKLIPFKVSLHSSFDLLWECIYNIHAVVILLLLKTQTFRDFSVPKCSFCSRHYWFTFGIHKVEYFKF